MCFYNHSVCGQMKWGLANFTKQSNCKSDSLLVQGIAKRLILPVLTAPCDGDKVYKTALSMSYISHMNVL